MKNKDCKQCGTEFVKTGRYHEFCSKKCKIKYWTVKRKPRTGLYKYSDGLKNPENRILLSAKHRAKKKGLDFNLELKDIEIPAVCPALGIPLKFKGERFYDSPSLDRTDNKKGYIKGNIEVISGRANMLKRNASLEELSLLVDYLKKKHCVSA